MKKILFISIVILPWSLFLNSCDKSQTGIDAPSCIIDIIHQIENEEVRNPPAKVVKWEVNGQTYYYITSDCCDQFNYLYDVNCNVVCAPDGGITGSGDGNCPAFVGQIEKTLVWEDERN